MSENIITESLLDFLYPPACFHCDRSMENHKMLCDECFEGLEAISFGECPVCGMHLPENMSVCPDHPDTSPFEPLQFIRSLGIFNDVLRNLVHGLKYGERMDIGIYFGHLLGKIIVNESRFRGFELVIPVPLYKTRQRERGYNQSERIARGIFERARLPYAKSLAVRTKVTKSQTELDLKQREENVRDIFALTDTKRIKEKNIIIVDDVITSGATVKSLARTLREAGAGRICAMCVARPGISQSKQHRL